MNVIQTGLQEKRLSFPNQLEFLRVLHFRGLPYFDIQKKLYVSLQSGDDGEQKVLEYLEAYGGKGWIVIRNMWLSDFGTFECDIILITRFCVYLFEVKNYNGLFSYDQGKCYFNSMETSVNPIEQCRRNVVNLRNMLSKVFPNLPVKAAVLFTGDDNDVQILSPVDDIEIKNRTQLKGFVQDIVTEERNSRPHYLQFMEIVSVLEQYEVANPYMPEPLLPEELPHIRGGIYCANCQSFDVKISKLKVGCSCGLIESREGATIRTIREYGTLFYKENLTRQNLKTFFGAHASITYLQRILHVHFEVIHNFKHTYYLNNQDN